ncbi:anti-anti-sigma regulatory factor [Actinoplanes octamycinicus]|uniref:Anti-anti-sigma regulatory factor n=1 Tax=Actinoplanes octamycinicus TaxID=135948 RepID=A0A7W7GZR9_9ACTN|nr:ATP-binding protein [Actinoplanes octamycinicus]MBB4741326.1 anti-anti-sigma regulatory factor [Actinoplanes octamycinicus]GIE62874.1 ATP-binding protein [Actinoplanes octamycinicus]
MTSLTWTTTEREGCAIVGVDGRLDLAAAPGLRTALLKCLAEQPRALLVDLSRMSLGDGTSPAVFTAVTRLATDWPGTPVLLCAPRPEVALLLGRGRFGSLQVRPDVDGAILEVRRNGAAAPMITDQLLPAVGAARHARDLAAEACVRWGVPHLVGPVSVIATELVSNAVEHAGTMITIQFVRRARYLHVVVRDGSPAIPVAASDGTDRGRGLLLVESLAVRWGTLPARDGKVVWATLAA